METDRNKCLFSRCTNSTRQTLQESEETWKDVFHAKRLISFQGFDEIFGHILGDPDEHFGLFTGDDVKKRARARALALAQLRKLHGGSGGVGDSFMAGGADKRRRTRSGSTARNSMMLGGSFAGSFSGAASMGGFGANMGSVANIAMSVANATKGARESRTSKAQVDKYKAGAMIDVYEVRRAERAKRPRTPTIYIYIYMSREGTVAVDVANFLCALAGFQRVGALVQ